MKKLVIANWKMLPETLAEAEEILAHTDEWLGGLGQAVPPNIVVCPPFVFLEEVAERLREGRLSALMLGAQDIAANDAPGQTGEVGGAQLASLGVHFAIVGHSERRWKLHEPDAVVHAKLLEALHHDLTPILCVGERARDAGWEERLSTQVRSGLAGLDGPDLARIIVAYEPVWAISTNPDARPDTPDSAAGAAAVIRAAIGHASPLLYGGSITPKNAVGFLHHEAFNGILVGGASVRARDFVAILQEAI